MESRKDFIAKVAASMAPNFGTTSKGAVASNTPIKDTFIHHVFFWLKEPLNIEAQKQFEQGLADLVEVPEIQSYHIGRPVESSREVVDDSFTYSYIAFFKNKEDQDIYQTHPIHLKFIADCQHLWTKVVVYDAL